MLQRFEIFSAPGTIAHGSIRLPPRSLASLRGCSLAIKSMHLLHLQREVDFVKKKFSGAN